MIEIKEFRFSDLLLKVIDNRGKTCPTVNTGIPLIATNCIKNDKLYPEFINVRFVSNDTYRNWFRAHPEPDDMIFVLKGTPGRVCWTPNPVSFCIAQDMVGIRANKEIVYPKYLFAILRSNILQKRIDSLHVGSLIPHFKKGDFDKLMVPVIVDKQLQQFIGDTYYDFCAKIELNNNINQELENLAQTLFKQWFIDFEFPNENGEPYKSSGGEMVESELGEIPRGWTVGTLKDILDVKGGTTPSTKEPSLWDGDIHWTSPKDLSSLNFPLLIDTEKKITELGLSKIGSGLLPKGTLLLSSRAPIGYLAITEIETAINQGYIAINGKKGVSNLYILYWLKLNMNLVIARANGSTFLEISKSNFKEIISIIPDSKTLNEYTVQIELLFSQLKNNVMENRELTNLRDTLLHKLISGELDVSQSSNAS